MTHNVHKKPPVGAWARCARHREGQFGIIVGHDAYQIGFIPEVQLSAWIDAGFKVDDVDDLLALVIDASDRLPKFKAEIQRRQTRSEAAGNN